MNIRICEDPACADIEVVVRCRQLDDTVLSLLARLRVYDAKLTGERDGATYVLAACPQGKAGAVSPIPEKECLL